MTITSGFYNSVDGDRTYNARAFSSLFKGIITDGVFMSVGDGLIVSQNSGMYVNVAPGRAWFNESWIDNDSTAIIPVDISEVVLDRIDAIVIEINSNDSIRSNTIKCIKGTPGSTPSNPTLENSEFVHQYPLAYIYITANVTTITNSMITNKVGSSECPFITGILETLDTGSLLEQFQADFDLWFNAMKDQLSTDAAGNLQTQIDEMSEVLGGINELYLDINGQKYKQLLILNFKPKKTNGCGDPDQLETSTNKNVYDYLPFDKNTVEYAYANIVLPSDFSSAHPMFFQPYWGHPTTSSYYAVKWGLKATSISNTESLDAAFGTPVYVNDQGGVANCLYIGDRSSSLLVYGSPVPGDLVQFVVSRDATDSVNDTLQVDAYLFGCLLLYPVE